MLFQFCHSVDHDCKESDDESSGNESSGDILFGSGFGSGSESKCEEGCDCPGQKLYNGTHCVPYQECSCVKPGTNEIVSVSILSFTTYYSPNQRVLLCLFFLSFSMFYSVRLPTINKDEND